jgi:S1-C subfamily serine protease
VPIDDDGDDDAPVFGAPLPPDDRLWRHPSELGGTATLAAPSPATNHSHPRIWTIAVVSGLVGAVLTVGVVAATGGLQEKVVEHDAPVEKVAVSPTFASFPTTTSDVVAIARAVGPAIARVQVTGRSGVVTGSAVAYRSDGFFLTNAHLLTDASSVAVALADGSTFDGAIVGTDEWTDVAVVHIDAHDVPPATIGSTATLQVGQQAIAVGAPVDDSGEPSVSVGVISALGRRVESTGGTTLHDMLATDARFGRDASGGALVDASGAVIGLSTVVSNDGADAAAMTLSYATPIEVATGVADDIITTGKAHHVWLGVEGNDLPATQAKALSVPGGAVVTKVTDDSPAAKAGLQTGDVITAINGTSVTSISSLVLSLRGHAPGEQVTIDYIRGASHRTSRATLDEKDAP